MADVDIMDLFDKEFIAGEEENSFRSSGIQDYKPQRSYNTGTPSKVKSSPSSEETRTAKSPLSTTPQKTLHNDIDERLVWVGAIFVFFGVFAFLLGYWLGNIKEKEITMAQKEKQTQIMEKIQEKQTEVSLKHNTLPVQQASEAIQPTTSSAQEVPVIPSLTEPTPPMQVQAKTTPKPTTTPKTETKPVPQIQPKQNTTPQPNTSTTGSYTLQVSAHTSLEKAQAVESQLRQAGHSPYIVETTINDITYYRVRIGSYSSKTEAESALTKVKQLPVGKDAYVLSLK